MTYDKELLKKKLEKFMGSTSFYLKDAVKKTKLNDVTIRKIINHTEIITNHNIRKKILDLFQVEVTTGHDKRMFGFKNDFAKIPDEKITSLLMEGLNLKEVAYNLGLEVSEYRLSRSISKRGIFKKIKESNPDFRTPFSFDISQKKEKPEIIIPKPKKRFKPLTMGDIDPLKNFDLKAELKKVRANQSRAT